MNIHIYKIFQMAIKVVEKNKRMKKGKQFRGKSKKKNKI